MKVIDSMLQDDNINIQKSDFMEDENTKEDLAIYDEIVDFLDNYHTYKEPFYRVKIQDGRVHLLYVEDDNYQEMEDLQDKKDFLIRIRRINADMLDQLIHKNKVFNDFVMNIEKRISATNCMNRLQQEGKGNDLKAKELAALLHSLERDEDKNAKFRKRYSELDLSELPLFNKKSCIVILLKQGRAYFSNYSLDVKSTMRDLGFFNDVVLIVERYIARHVDKFIDYYIEKVEEDFKAGKSPVIDSGFILDFFTDDMQYDLKEILRRLFVDVEEEEVLVDKEVYVKNTMDEVMNYLRKLTDKINHYLADVLRKNGVTVLSAEEEENKNYHR